MNDTVPNRMAVTVRYVCGDERPHTVPVRDEGPPDSIFVRTSHTHDGYPRSRLQEFRLLQREPPIYVQVTD